MPASETTFCIIIEVAVCFEIASVYHVDDVNFRVVMAKQGSTVCTTNFPLYGVTFVDHSHFLVAGGGGSSKTGIPNAIVRTGFESVKLLFF